jgi:hypothetical protein
MAMSVPNKTCMQTRYERKTGITTEPMRFPWEREWESELDGNGNDSTGMRGNGNRTVPLKGKKNY